MAEGNEKNITTKFEYDRYTAVDGKFVHLTPEFYNPYFDGGIDPVTGKKRKAKKDVSKVGFST